LERVTIAGHLLFAFAAGAMLPIQFGINAQLARWIESPVRAALVSFIVGALALLLVTIALYRQLPPTTRLGSAPWWVWIGGLFGAFYVLGSVVAAPKLGAVTLVALILAGQAVSSLLVDHFGWVGFEEQPISLGRIGGVLLLAAGVALVRIS
jgi:bacterial/archaeal transporter family-2 protein